MERDPRLVQLGAFLRSRRNDMSVAENEPNPRRRVPGLRRDEVAARTFISTEYYTRIEQGRASPGVDVVRRIAEVLRLNDDQIAYALDLVTNRPVATRVADSEEPLARVVDYLGDAPALVVGPDTMILAWNTAAAELLVDFGQIPLPERLFTRALFTDSKLQSRFVDLPDVQRTAIGIVRTSSPSGVPAGAWIDELCATHPNFAQMWNHNDAAKPHVLRRVQMMTRDGDRITLDQVVLQAADDSSHRLIVFVPVSELQSS